MSKISKSIDIDAPAERVWEFMTQPENLPSIWPSLVEVSNVQRKNDGTHSFDWVYKMAGVRFSGHSESSDVDQHRHIVVKNERGIPSTFNWRYEAKGQKTHLELDLEYSIPGKILSKVAEPVVHRINEREAETLLLNLKDQIETRTQPQARPRTK